MRTAPVPRLPLAPAAGPLVVRTTHGQPLFAVPLGGTTRPSSTSHTPSASHRLRAFGGHAVSRHHRQHRSDKAAENAGPPHGPLQIVQSTAPGDFDHQEHLGAIVAPQAMHDDVGQPHLFPIIFRDDPTLQARVEQLIEFAVGVGPRSPEEALA